MKNIVGLLSVGFFTFHLWGWGQSLYEKRQIQKKISSPQHVASSKEPMSNASLESTFQQLAKESKIRQLVSLERIENQGQQKIRLQWRGQQNASLHFLSLLKHQGLAGTWSEMRLSQDESTNGSVTGFGLFERATVAISTTPGQRFAHRNVFRAPWRRVKKKTMVRSKKPTTEELAKKKAEEERRRAEQEEKARQDRLISQKRRLETNWILTGVVHNGTELLAFISKKGPNGQGRMVRQGDNIDGARVTTINEEKGELHLNYQDKFDVVLQLNTNL